MHRITLITALALGLAACGVGTADVDEPSNEVASQEQDALLAACQTFKSEATCDSHVRCKWIPAAYACPPGPSTTPCPNGVCVAKFLPPSSAGPVSSSGGLIQRPTTSSTSTIVRPSLSDGTASSSGVAHP